MIDGSVSLPDDRTLAYAEWGDPRGEPVFLFHGSAGSRLFRPEEAVTRACGVRLITVDRPGFGRSDPLPGRTLLGWPEDVAGLAHELAIGSFGVVGYSSGGPHALACGAVLTQRVTALAVVGCPAPPDGMPGASERLDDANRILLDAIDGNPAGAIAAYGEQLAALVEDPTAVLDGPLPEPDRRLRDDPAILWMWRESLKESARQGVVGWAWEAAAVHRPWGFRLEDVRLPVSVWHGRRDTIVPVEHARYLADHLATCQLTVWPDAGHGGLVMHWREVLMAIRQPRADESRR